MAGIETRRGLAQRRHRVAQICQRLHQRVEGGFDVHFVQRPPGGAAQRQVVHRRAQRPRRLLEVARWLLHGGQRARDLLAFGDRIARQFHQRACTQPLAEELRGQLRQLVGLVDDERLRARQDLAEAFLLQRQVGQQQVVVDHHQVGRLRPLARLHHETFAPERALGTQAVVSGGGDQRQQRRILRQRFHLRHVAAAGAPAPGDHALELADLLPGSKARLALGLLHPVTAQIVGPTLQQRGLQADAERIAHPRQIAQVELVLQRASAGADDGLHSRQQRRHEVGVGLAGTGAGLCQQHLAAFERIRHRHRQPLLRRSRAEAGQRLWQRRSLAQLFAHGPAQPRIGCRHRAHCTGRGAGASGGGSCLAGSPPPKKSRIAWPARSSGFSDPSSGGSGLPNSSSAGGGTYGQGW